MKNLGLKSLALAVPILLAPAQALLAMEAMSVSVPSANVRSGPSTDNSIIWKISHYHPVKVADRRGDWCHFVDFENEKGWVHCGLLDNTRTIIAKGKSNVRDGPATNQRIKFMAARGAAFKVLQVKNDWYNVQHSDGDKGWIHKSRIW